MTRLVPLKPFSFDIITSEMCSLDGAAEEEKVGMNFFFLKSHFRRKKSFLGPTDKTKL